MIDELSDLMMQVKDPVEGLIMRLAQKSRAAGIHLILGTQRPSFDVLTGTIRANIPTRICFKVTSQVDSRTVLESTGAEKLLSKGDMLFRAPSSSTPIRVQSAFISDSEVEAFTKEQREKGKSYDDAVTEAILANAKKLAASSNRNSFFEEEDDEDKVDQCFIDAVELAIRSKKISTSLLQRKLSIGYGKAAKYIDAMEELGIVSQPNGQKPRDVLITMEEWQDKLSRL